MNKDTGSHDLAKKDPGTNDVGPRKIDFGEGKASPTPAPASDPSSKRPDSESCYSEFANRNSDKQAPPSQASYYNTGPLECNVSSKDNGGK